MQHFQNFLAVPESFSSSALRISGYTASANDKLALARGVERWYGSGWVRKEDTTDRKHDAGGISRKYFFVNGTSIYNVEMDVELGRPGVAEIEE
jgi:hypothetical protein